MVDVAVGVGIRLEISDVAHRGVFTSEEKAGIGELLGYRCTANCRGERVVVAVGAPAEAERAVAVGA